MAVRAVLVTPLSGALAEYGRAGAAGLRVWADRFADPGPVRLAVIDAHPDPRAAVREAEQHEPDLLFGPYGSGPMAKVAAATELPVFNHGGALLEPREHVVNVLAPAASYFRGALEALQREDPGIRRVSVLHGETGFGRGVGRGAEKTAERLGLAVERVALPVEPPDADVLLVAGRFEEELAVARRLRRGRWAAFVGAGVDEVLAELGDRREGLLGPAQWLPSAAPEPDEGPTAAEFVAAYRNSTGTEPPYPAAQAFASGIIAARCLREAGVPDRSGLLEAARRLDRTTLFGRFRLDPASGRQVGHRVLTVQWQDGERVVVWPPEQARATLRRSRAR